MIKERQKLGGGQLEAYLAEVGRDAGCPVEQMRHFVEAWVVLQPRQLAASAAVRCMTGRMGAARQFFTTFRRDVHVVTDFDKTRAREWFAALDYGFAHYTVVLLRCTDGDGNVFVVDEHAGALCHSDTRQR